MHDWTLMRKLVWLKASVLSAAEAVYQTVTGAVATFTTVRAAPLKSLTAAIVPVQEGTGDPSPTNIRQISRYAGCTISKSGADISDPETIFVSWKTAAGDVCGGILNVTTGKLTAEGILCVFDKINPNYTYILQSQIFEVSKLQTAPTVLGDVVRITLNRRGGIDLSNYATASNQFAYKMCNLAKHYFAYNDTSVHWYINSIMYLFLPVSVVGTTSEDVFNYLVGIKDTTPLSVWVPYINPVTYQLTPQEVRALKGVNNIWADTGDVTLEYRAN